MAHDIGTRLRRVREGRALSQRALAKTSGISNATISLIESGKLNPSVAVAPVVYRSSELVEIGGGKISYRQVGHQLTDRTIQILHERYEPGADTGKLALEHAGEEGGVVIRGRLELTVAGERHVLGPGDAYYFDSSRPHHFRNIGTESCEVVSACSPPSF
ncbi:MAG: cupin domain-containing protein [Deltaproteobacteria bacterium]|nr:cupin domain-containing protein [Deltaproteobacteria bacterium]